VKVQTESVPQVTVNEITMKITVKDGEGPDPLKRIAILPDCGNDFLLAFNIRVTCRVICRCRISLV
jgi:hypothetical protein